MKEKAFIGFSQKSSAIPVPDIFFTDILPKIDNINELRITLYVYWMVKHKKGYPRFVTIGELYDRVDMVRTSEKTKAELLEESLEQARLRGTLLLTELSINGKEEKVVFFNMDPERSDFQELSERTNIQAENKEKPPDLKNIYSLYEQNIGIITPIVAEELRRAEEEYPGEWIADAFKEAVDLNKRNWRYISRILETWSTKGKDYGKNGRHIKKTEGTEKFFRGKYGHMVQR